MPARRPTRPPPGHSMLLPRTEGGATQRAFDAVSTSVAQVQRTLSAAQDSIDDVTPGRLLAVPTILTGSGSGTLPDGTCVVHLRGIGQGGGGGGGGSGAAGAGGSSGALLDIWIGTPGTPLATLAYTWAAGSAAGTGGNNTGTNGVAGSDSTFVHNAVTYTAKGGGGGLGQPNSAVINAAVPAVPAGGTGPGGLVSFGHGGCAFGDPGVTGFSGAGGGTAMGAGGAAISGAGGAGNAGANYGGGGSGGIGANAGGSGAPGCIEITPYT